MLPKLNSKSKVIQGWNVTGVNILFIIPIIITLQGYKFEIYTVVSEIHGNVELV